MKMKKFFAGVMTAAMVLGSLTLPETINMDGFGVISARAAEVVNSGTCGDNLTWVLDDEGTLTISGTGEMDDYSWPAEPPWESERLSIVSVVIEEGVTSIGYGAFSSCLLLASVDLPDSLMSISEFAFNSCSNLVSIEIPDSVEDIGSYAFCGCNKLADENGFIVVANILFDYCGDAIEIEIPGNVVLIDDSAFEDNDNLTSIKISDGVTTIGYGAFLGCDNLTSVEIPDSVTSIGARSFYLCRSLTSVEIPGTVTDILSETFAQCSALTQVKISNGVTSIGMFAFDGCSSLTSVEIPDSVETIDLWAFSNCSSLTSIIIPDSVTEINDKAFGYSINTAEATTEKNENVTIYGYIGSAAETYAEENDIAFVALAFEINNLTEVPSSLSEKYASVDDLNAAMIALVTEDAAYTEENTSVYDVVLMISTDGGTTWQETTEEYILKDGITVTLSYPEGTDSSYDFVAAHMFTETNETLETVAGEVEYPAVTKTDDGIRVTLKGLSPVAVSWALSSPTEDAAGEITLGDASGDGEINYLDAMAVLRYDAELTDLSAAQLAAADVNGDGLVNSLDAILILRYDAGLIENFE